MLSFPTWCLVILVGFLMLCAALVIFLQWWRRKRDNSPNRGPTVDYIKQLHR
jgi:uncharacterized iron-regulated membrane protein